MVELMNYVHFRTLQYEIHFYFPADLRNTATSNLIMAVSHALKNPDLWDLTFHSQNL